MMKILAFGASTSSKSINKRLAHYTAGLFNDFEVTAIDLRDYELPLYSEDYENDKGFPENARRFHELIKNHDGIIISLAEHNSNVTAAYKNLEDWASRFEGSTWRDRKVFLLSTSNGKRGGAGAMKLTRDIMPWRGGNVVAHFCLPEFSQNFSDNDGILDEDLKSQYLEQVDAFRKALHENQDKS